MTMRDRRSEQDISGVFGRGVTMVSRPGKTHLAVALFSVGAGALLGSTLALHGREGQPLLLSLLVITALLVGWTNAASP